MITLAGIDYSLTSPGVCVYSASELADPPTFQRSHHYFQNSIKRHDGLTWKNLKGSNHKSYKTEQERHSNLADWVMGILEAHNVDRAFIEGYSYGSAGKVFNIAENTGVLKDRMWKKKIPFHTIAPSAIKKFATGKGNANKDKMYKAFQSECSEDLAGNLTPKAMKIISPVADIVDAYYICKYGWNTLK